MQLFVRSILLALVIAGGMWLPLLSTIIDAQESVLPPELATLLVDGVAVQPLAVMNLSLPADDQITPLLSRLTATASGDPEPAIVVAPEVWYVEEGTLTLFDPRAGQANYVAGEQVSLSRADIYQYRITGDGCPSVLRFQVQIGAGMEISSSESKPALGPNRTVICPAGGNFNTSWMSQPMPQSAAVLVIARVTLSPFAFASDTTLSGPAMLVAEHGTVDAMLGQTYQARFTPGGSVLLPAGNAFTLTPAGEEGATLLLAAVLSANASPATTTTSISHDYTSPTFGYTLDWSDDWSVLDESSVDGVDRLQLANGVSTIFLQGFTTNLPDAFACIDSALTGYTVAAGYGELATIEPASGDAAQATAVYSYTWTQGSTAASFAALLSCQWLPGGKTAVFLSHTAPLVSYETEAVAASEVIGSLRLPG